MKTISILSHDLSSNSLSRAWVLAKLLSPEYKVHIIGPAGKDIWEPVRNDTSIEYRTYPIESPFKFLCSGRKISKQYIDGDLVLAVKPHFASFGLGLAARRARRRPLLLDIDDWEVGFLMERADWELRGMKLRWFKGMNSPFSIRYFDFRARMSAADAITVSSQFLQERYGGTWIGQARDENDFQPPATNGRTDAVQVLFLGTVREHKGVDVLIDAWRSVKSDAARLQIVGSDLNDPYVARLSETADARTTFLGPIPFEHVPAAIAECDIYVVPQKNVRAAAGQTPMKLIDAMAMGRAIVATKVSDIPSWLDEGAGEIATADNPAALEQSLNRLIEDPQHRIALGQQARRRFLEFASYESVRRRLFPLVESLLAGKRKISGEPPFAESYRLRTDESKT